MHSSVKRSRDEDEAYSDHTSKRARREGIHEVFQSLRRYLIIPISTTRSSHPLPSVGVFPLDWSNYGYVDRLLSLIPYAFRHSSFSNRSFFAAPLDWSLSSSEVTSGNVNGNRTPYSGPPIILRHMAVVPFKQIAKAASVHIIVSDDLRRSFAVTNLPYAPIQSTNPLPGLNYPLEPTEIIPIQGYNPRYLVTTSFGVKFSPAYENSRLEYGARSCCAICLCNVMCDGIDIDCTEHGTNQVVVDCGHIFHWNCFVRYRSSQARPRFCPYCKEFNSEALFITIGDNFDHSFS